MTGNLPEGWVETFVDSVAESINYGFTAKSNSHAKGPRYLRITDIQDGDVNWASVPFCELPPSKRGLYTLRPGDLVFARTGATTGKSYLISACPDAVFASYLIRVRPTHAVIPKFLACFFQTPSYWEQISENVSGSAQPNCNASKLSRIAVRLPPVDEQRRIVAAVEPLLARVKAAQDRLDKIPTILKRFRQAVLAAGCNGRLTAEWRARNPNGATADAIVTTIRQRREMAAGTPAQKERIKEIYRRSEESDASDLPDTWGFVALNKLCESFDYGTSTKSQPSGKVSVLRMGNIQNGRIDWADLVYTSDQDEIDKYRLLPNTVLFNRTNSPELVGKTGLYRGERPAIFAGYLIRANHEPELDPEYLNLCLNTSQAREFCRMVKTDGVSQSNINAQKLGTFEVPFCSLPEQREIVRRVNSLFALIDRIQHRYEKAQSYADNVSEALLAKAFRGELVPTEAELARREGRTYESAQELLARTKKTQSPGSGNGRLKPRRGSTESHA